MEQAITSRVLLMLAFMLAGFVYVRSGTRRAIPRHKPFGFTLTLAAIVFLVMTGVYGVQGRPFLIIPAACACSFLIPTLLSNTWLAYFSIPGKHFPVWFSAQEDLVPAEIRAEPAVEIHFDVSVQGGPAAGIMLFTTLPVNEPLGQAFVGALIRHNEQFPGTAVPVTDGQGYPFGWQFYEVHLKGAKKNFLDPKTLLGGPALKNRTHIAVKRCHSQRPVIYRMKAR